MKQQYANCGVLINTNFRSMVRYNVRATAQGSGWDYKCNFF